MRRKLQKRIPNIIFFILVLIVISVFYNHFKLEKTISYLVVVESKSNPTKVSFPSNNLEWYFKHGTVWPSLDQEDLSDRIWPSAKNRGDRIVEQLMYLPEEIPSTIKNIYVENPRAFGVKQGQSLFLDCPVNQCNFVSKIKGADAALFRDFVSASREEVPPEQIWIIYALENPYNTGRIEKNTVNWTATYRTHSDIVTPYEKWVYYNESVRRIPQKKNYAFRKKRKVAWFVSNCNAKNNRLEYAKELQNYIAVDIFGSCGNKRCYKKDECFKMLSKDYKFYLSFENGNCREYITEKFFVNALRNNVLPIVMGAHPNDYKKLAPWFSYIHVEQFQSAEELATFLNLLDKDDELYNTYFEWKGTGEFINTYFFCRLCAMLHSNHSSKTYGNFESWWNPKGTCIKGRWT